MLFQGLLLLVFNWKEIVVGHKFEEEELKGSPLYSCRYTECRMYCWGRLMITASSDVEGVTNVDVGKPGGRLRNRHLMWDSLRTRGRVH